MEAASLIAMFGQECGLSLTLGVSGTLDLVFVNDIVLTLEHDEPQDLLHCYVVVGRDPADTRERAAVHRSMLAGNAFGHETSGATLALDELSGDLVLSRQLALCDSDVRHLRQAVETMVNTALDWREKIAALCRSAGEEALPPATTPISGSALRA